MEIALIFGLASTMSRGSIVVLICVCISMRILIKNKIMAGEPLTKKIIGWISYNPIWRLFILFCNSGLWGRSKPSFVAQDASISNRVDLWLGATKLISSAPLRGWSYPMTGAEYMNWFQNTSATTYYNGLVNSFLQIGAAWGLLALFFLLSVIFYALSNAKHLAGKKRSVGILCFLLILIWTISSLFSSMLSSVLLILPPLAASLVAITLHPLKKKPLISSLTASAVICLLLYVSGSAFAWKDPLTITTGKNGIVSITNEQAKSIPTCAICVDEEALGRHYGKEVRKFMLKNNIGNCLIIKTSKQLAALGETAQQVDLVLLSGATVAKVVGVSRLPQRAPEAFPTPKVSPSGGLHKIPKFILLNPTFLPESLECESIQTIVFPEIDRYRHLELQPSHLGKLCQSKIKKIPFNENFETSWSKHVNL